MPDINELRKALMDTLTDLRNPEKPMEVDRARAVAQVAGVLVDTARVEIEFIKATGGDRSDFIAPDLPKPELPKGIVGITRHLIAG